MKVKVLNTSTQLEVREMNLGASIAQDGECLLGRSPCSGLILDSPDVSRLHAKFVLEEGEYYFYDLGSANGSLVNGKVICPNQGYLLKPGDIIRVGEFVLMLYPVGDPLDLPATVVGDPNRTVIERRWDVIEPASDETAAVADSVNESGQLHTDQASTVNQPADLRQENDDEVVEAEGQVDVSLEDAAIENDILENLAIDETTPLAVSDITVIQLEDAIELSQSNAGIAAFPIDEDAIDQQYPSDSNSALSDEPSLMQSDGSSDSVLLSVQLSESTSSEADLYQTDQPIDAVNQLPNSTAIASEAHSTAETDHVEADELKQPETVEVITKTDFSEPTNTQPGIQFNNGNESDGNLLPLGIETGGSEAVDIPEVGQPSQPNLAELDKEDANEAEQQNEASTTSSELLIQPNETLHQRTEGDETELQAEGIPDPSIASVLTDVISSTDATDDADPVITPENEEAVLPEQEAPEVSNETSDETTTVVPAISTAVGTDAVVPSGSQPADAQGAVFSEKYVALLAHDSQIPSLVELVLDHKNFFSHCLTVATPIISDVLKQQVELEVSYQTPATPLGSYQTMNSWMTSDKILAVIFLKDFLTPQMTQTNDEAFSRSCNVRQVLFASNLSTAKALMHYLQSKTLVNGAALSNMR